MPVPARLLADALADSPAALLLHKLREQQRLADIVAPAIAHLVPNFRPHEPGVCELRDGVLFVGAQSAAVATKLRQGIPGLLRLLHQSGVQVNEIRLRVQPSRNAYPEQVSEFSQAETNAEQSYQLSLLAGKQAAIRATAGSDAALRFTQALEETLPDSELRASIKRLQQTLKKYRAP